MTLFGLSLVLLFLGSLGLGSLHSRSLVLLLSLFSFLVLLLGSRHIAGLDTHLRHCPLGQLHADPILAGLNDDGVRIDHYDLTDNAADAGDHIALLQSVTHSLCLLFTLVLRANHKEIQRREHHYQQNNALIHVLKISFEKIR